MRVTVGSIRSPNTISQEQNVCISKKFEEDREVRRVDSDQGKVSILGYST